MFGSKPRALRETGVVLGERKEGEEEKSFARGSSALAPATLSSLAT